MSSSFPKLRAAASNALDRAATEAATAKFEADPVRRLAQNAVTRGDVNEVLARRQVTSSYNHTYSNKIPKEAKCTSQKSSGRCWMFAALNVARLPLIKKYNLSDDFELSQGFTFFWDKYERANYFLEAIVATADEPLDGRVVQHLLSDPMCDGGQWDMFVNVVNKYGLCPKSVYPESYSMTASLRMNRILTGKLRGWAAELRAAGANTAPLKAEMMETFLSMLLTHLGTPPAKFDWSFHNKDGKEGQTIKGLTPLSFVEEHLNGAAGHDLNDFVSLINDPRNDYGKTYTVALLGNVVGGADVKYINAPIDMLREKAAEAIDAGEAVWFGCDVGKEFNRSMAVMDTALYDYDLVYKTAPSMDKETRLRFGESLMTHAMVFTAYDRDAESGKILKWRVENSWGNGKTGAAPAGGGDKFGLPNDGGYYLMTDEWFDEFVYQVAVKRERLDAGSRALVDDADTAPVELPPWDPMGSLA